MIKEIFNKYKIEINEQQEKKLYSFFQFLIEENKKYNLTAITEEKDVIFKHFLDSVLPVNNIPYDSNVLDVGTGAGFPGIPLKILRNDLNLTLLDSLNKRINFLNQSFSLLNLKGIKAIHSRIEDLPKENKFDFVVSRAVSNASTLAEYTLPFVKIGGYALFYKSKSYLSELEEAKKAIEVLGGEIDKIDKFYFKEVDAERVLIYIKKIKETPKIYPRGKNLPKIKPIN